MHAISRKTIATGGAATLGALALVGALASASTAAATTYTVSVGTTTSGTASLTGASNATLSFVDIDAVPPIKSTCTSSTANATAKLTTKAKAPKLATIASSTFTGCKSNGQLDLSVAQVGKWTFNANGPTTTGGVTPGTLSKIVSNVHDTDGLGCSFTIGGTVDASYSNSSGALNFAPVSGTTNYLKISKQKGNCLGLVVNGHRVSFTGGYNIHSTSPSGSLVIKSN